ncbi:hypothetical protein P3W24_15220 [Luteibacter sp. PPL201]|uniref:Heme exporter protein D n=1 Tax=Luteibacter sahnii TaxID=3021977 RepID=A0ABT6BEP2_9GAMM
MQAFTGVFILAVLVGVGILWECSRWISARTKLLEERARQLKLDNDAREGKATQAPNAVTSHA